MSVFGIIAGNGPLPLWVAQQVRSQGRRVIAIAHMGETDPRIKDLADEVEWIHVGEVGRLISSLRARGVKEVMFVGGIDKARAIKDARIDHRGLQILANLDRRGDDQLLSALARELEAEGISVVGLGEFMQAHFMEAGVVTKTTPSPKHLKDMELGVELLIALGQWDIGQTVVIKDGVVLAVEAVEGTDQAITRAGQLGGEGFVVVKGCKPHQDERFDLPVAGTRTVEIVASLGGSALALEAKRTILLGKEEMIKRADDAGIAIVGWERTDRNG